ncbi:MAG: DNA polymerase III subunit beta [Thermodesulfovibrionales bacterium]|nr:DNA polymerase III subunit beta [Thermodesulfovibrionales bacterium]
MKIKVNKEAIQKKLANIQSLVNRKETQHIINNFLLIAESKYPLIVATDLETAYKDLLEMDIKEEGRVCIHGVKFFEIIKEVDKELTIETLDRNWIKISSGRSLFKLACLPYEDFPKWPELEKEAIFSLKLRDLQEIISKTLYASKDSDTRFFLNGLLFRISDEETLTVVGTDGHRLALAKLPIELKENGSLEKPRDILISKNSLIEIRKVFSDGDNKIDMVIGKNHVLFKVGNLELLTRQVDGNFPQYEQAIPKEFIFNIKANRLDLLKSLKKVSIMSKERGYIVRLDIEKDKMTISSSDPDYGEAVDELNIEHSGDNLSISFNAKYLLDAIDHMSSDKVDIKMIDPLKAVMLKEIDSEDYICLVMPLRS